MLWTVEKCAVPTNASGTLSGCSDPAATRSETENADIWWWDFSVCIYVLPRFALSSCDQSLAGSPLRELAFCRLVAITPSAALYASPNSINSHNSPVRFTDFTENYILRPLPYRTHFDRRCPLPCPLRCPLHVSCHGAIVSLGVGIIELLAGHLLSGNG